MPGTLLKKETLSQGFSCEFLEISKDSIFTEHVWVTPSGCLTMIKDDKISVGKKTISI